MQKGYDISLGSLKIFLIYLVVFWHCITPLQDTSWLARGVYDCIYSFHMPLFAILSGYFSRNITSHRRKDIETLLYPYIIFQVIWIVYYRILPYDVDLSDMSIFTPIRHTWYLLALFIWRLLTPYCIQFDKWKVLLVSILLLVYIGIYPIYENFGIHRVVYFFPFYLCGLLMPQYVTSAKNASRWLKNTAILVLPVVFGLLFWLSRGISHWSLINNAYCPMECCTSIRLFGARVLAFTSSFVISYLVMVLWHNIIMHIQYRANTMLIYVAHYYFIIPLWPVLTQIHIAVAFGICLLYSALICFVFSTEIMNKVCAPILNLEELKTLLNKTKNIFKQ